MNVPVSVVMIAKNEAKRMRPALESARWADEIVVVDSGSADDTARVAREYTGSVHARPFDDFASQKNHAVSLAKNDWVFVLDADETIPQGLAQEIRALVDGPATCAAYAVGRRTTLFGRIFRHSGLDRDRPTRLFRRSSARFIGAVHETVTVKGATGRLKGTLEHRSFQTVHEHLDRLQLYTSLEAVEPDARPGRMLTRPLGRFVSIYLFKAGFLDGVEGFLYAALSSYYEFVRRAKAWEKTRGPSR